MKMDNLKDIRFDWTQSYKELRQAYLATEFDNVFHKSIAKDVIRVFSPQLLPEPHNPEYDQDQIHAKLIEPLERFICDKSSREDVEQVIENLRTLKQSSKMCRKVLKAGDVLFSCNDCKFDDTCVVCIECFLKSEHVNHNYRMSNTDGGGCCDCGDTEAWKQFPACSDHKSDQPNLTLADFETREKRSKQFKDDKDQVLEKISQLPDPGLAARFFLVCQASLNYARLMISWSDDTNLPETLDYNDEEKDYQDISSTDVSTTNFFTVLFNDEVHTYDHVINVLVRIIQCDKMTASIMASSVSREGRSYILQDSFDTCKQVRDAIAHVRDSGHGHGPLKVEVIHGNILAHQAYALKLLEWIKKMALSCDVFRALTAFTLFGDTYLMSIHPLHGTLLETIMTSNTTYWKIARVLWNDLFVTSLLSDYHLKELFARLITRIYPSLIDDYLKDDHDHSVSIMTMTTQLYTVPSLICMLIEEENALSTISKTLVKVYSVIRRETPHMGSRQSYDRLKRGFSIISDFRHLVSVRPTIWTEELRNNVIEAVKTFLDLLSKMQGMDSVKRQLGQHLEYEQEWETGMNLQSRLTGLITKLVEYCSYDDIVLTKTLTETQDLLLKMAEFKKTSRELLGYHTHCIQYDVSSAPVSVHLPLTRFAAALMLQLMQLRPCDTIPFDESLIILTDCRYPSKFYLRSSQDEGMSGGRYSMIEIMEHSLRTELLIAQFRANMWRRNGFSLANQILYSTGPLLRKEMFDRDILCIQICAATCESNEFMIHLLNKFNLINWISSETTREPLIGKEMKSYYNDDEILTQTMLLAEEFMQLLLTIVGERNRVGIGEIHPDDVMKSEIIHLLCIEPLTRSDIAHKLYISDSELDCIKSIANLRRLNESAAGKYELKEECYAKFNQFFYHYNRRQQSQALDAQLRRKRNLKDPLNCCPPPEPVKLTQQFMNLRQLLNCDITLHIVAKILRRSLGPPADAQECSTKAPIRFIASDLQIDQCLHLIGLGLYEQERDPVGFNYLMAAHGKEVFSLLRDCYEKAKRSKDLIHWIMNKTMKLMNFLDTMHANNLDEQQSRIYTDIKACFAPILSTCDTIKEESEKRTSEMAAKRRERIMAMMKAKQEKFLANPSIKQLAAETAEHEAPSQQKKAAASVATAIAKSNISETKARGVINDDDDDEKMDCQSLSGANASSKIKEPDTETNATQEENMIDTSHLCILCRDKQLVDFDKPTMVLLTYIQRSTVLSKSRGNRRVPYYALTPSNWISKRTDSSNYDLQLHQQQQQQSSRSLICGHLVDHRRMAQMYSRSGASSRGSGSTSGLSIGGSGSTVASGSGQTSGSGGGASSTRQYSFTSDNSWTFDASFMPSDLFFGPHVSTCGHVMHYTCWRGYLEAVTKRETSRPNRAARHVSFELDKHEILCPLCECISNSAIPLMSNYSRVIPSLRSLSDNYQHSKRIGVFGLSPEAVNKSADNLVVFLHAMRGAVGKIGYVRHAQNLTTKNSTDLSPKSGTSKVEQSSDTRHMLVRPADLNDALEDLSEQESLALRDFIATTVGERVSSSACSENLLNCITSLAQRIHSVGLDLDTTTAAALASAPAATSASLAHELNSANDNDHARIFMMTSWSISYTIQAFERSNRLKLKSIFADLESSRSLCIQSLVRYSCASMMTHQSDVIQSLLVKKFRYLLIEDEHFMSPLCCLDIDAFELFVSLFIMLQKLYSHDTTTGAPCEPMSLVLDGSACVGGSGGGAGASSSTSSDQLSLMSSSSSFKSTSSRLSNNWLDDQNYAWTTQAYDHEYYHSLLHMVLILNVIQIMLTMNEKASQPPPAAAAAAAATTTLDSDNQQQDVEMTFNNNEEDNTNQSSTSNQPSSERCFLSNFNNMLQTYCRENWQPNWSQTIGEEYLIKVKEGLLPFLRSCAIFLYQIASPSTNTFDPKLALGSESPEEEFSALCNYLSLPDKLDVLLKSSLESSNLVRAWAQHPRVALLIAENKKLAEANDESDNDHDYYDHPSRPTTTAASTATTVMSCSPKIARHNQQQQQQHHTSASLLSSSSSFPNTITNELMPVRLIRQPHRINRLVELPYDYNQLVDMVSDFTCPNIKNDELRSPTMCLVCGAMLCSQSYCCQRDLNDLASNHQPLIREREASMHQMRRRVAGASGSGGGVEASPSSSSSSSSVADSFRARSSVAAVMHGLTAAAAGADISLLPATAAAAAAAHGNELIFSGPLALNQATTTAAGTTTTDNATGATTQGTASTAANQSQPTISIYSSTAAAAAAATNLSTTAPTTATHHHHYLHHHHHHQYHHLKNYQQQLVGSCTYHSYECTGGAGIYLRIRNCQLLLLSNKSKGCYMPAPYIDDHGETDFGLLRGNPLHLDRQRYERLQHLWLNHAIPEQISRTLEHSQQSNITWHLH